MRYSAGFLISALAAVTCAAQPIALNSGSTTYDHHPSVAVCDDGTTWVAWHTYKDGTDGIAVRQVDRDGRLGPVHAITETGRVHGPPTVIANSANQAWVIWSAKVGGRWRVTFREWRDGRWRNLRRLSTMKHDAIFPTAVLDFDDNILAAWSERVDEHSRIRGCRIENDESPQVFDISDDDVDAYRPRLLLHDAEVWAFWDQYRKPNYSVHGCRLFPTADEIQRVSPDGEYCLTPSVLSHPTGLHVAWLRKIDVVGGPGVISQWHTLHAAVRERNQWRQIVDADGKTEAAELTHGLMAKIAPKPVATGGYLGSRVRPMLHSSGEQVWLLWERKSDHRGGTAKISGDLVGRPIDRRTWQTPVVLHRGYVDYHVLHSNKGDDRRLSVVASKLPNQARRTYERFKVELADERPLEQEAWTGWNPVALPIRAELTTRRKVNLGGQTYKLYWGDLHCHSNLSADAEGEVDELNHYARDRAGLDVVVFTNNDFYNVPLTQYEYEVGNLFAKSHSISGEFLSFPGYEWTSRIPGVPTASLGDPGNWLPPYRNRSYANHRSVIYPPTGGPLVHFTEVGNEIAKLNQAVEGAGGITLSQHPTFKLSGHAVEVGLELTSGWSNYISRNPKLFHTSLDQGRQGRRRRGLDSSPTGIHTGERPG